MADFSPSEQCNSLREQGGAIVSDVRAAVLHATRHLEALAELLQLELQEYGRAQFRRMVCIAVGAVLLLVGYAFLWLVGVVVCGTLWGAWGVYGALGAATLFNILVGLWALCRGIKRKPAGIAPATCRELNDDLQCIKLYLRGKEKS